MTILVKCLPSDIHDTNLVVRGGQGLPPIRPGLRPEPGEQLFIWSIESRGGGGLGARGTVAGFDQGHRSYEITIRVDEALPSRSLSFAYLQAHRGQRDILGEFAEAVCRDAHPSILRLTDEQTAWLLQEYYRAETSAELPQYAINQQSQYQQERQRTWSLIEQRAGQGAFRAALIQRDGPICAITGCQILQVVEAAHLIPFANGDPDRDDPQNGVLLRADIHILFDRGLMAIDPESRELWIADELAGTEYEHFRISGRPVVTGAADRNVRYQFDWSRSLLNRDPLLRSRIP